MTFFNKKEEVFDIQLTQYGKHLLSRGEFTPFYYAFFDDGVVYDSKHGGFDETQNSTGDRIQNKTPSIRTQHAFNGAETRIAQERVSQLRQEQLLSLTCQLGNGKIDTDKIPAWDLKLYQGRIDNVEPEILRLTGSSEGATIPTQQIPQIEVRCEYATYINDINEIDPTDLSHDLDSILVGYDDNASSIFDDGTFVQLKTEDLLIELMENNTDFEMQNFDIEVFIVDSEELAPIGTIERLKRLMFKKPPATIINDILLDEAEIPEYEDETGPQYVEYYFDIFVDKEIDEQVVCDSVGALKARGYKIESPYECPDTADKLPYNIYRSDVAEEDLETCQE
jgi:hypothetical protein